MNVLYVCLTYSLHGTHIHSSFSLSLSLSLSLSPSLQPRVADSASDSDNSDHVYDVPPNKDNILNYLIEEGVSFSL